MRRILIQNCKPGMILGQELFGERGELLLDKGVPITGGQIDTLTSLGCTSVVVDDEESRGIHLPQLVSNIVRFKTATRLTKTMTDLRGITAGMLDEDPVLATAALDTAFTTGQFRRQIREVDPFANLIMEVQELVDEIMHAERLDGLDPLVLHHDYALEQSIDSAIVAAMIGKTIGLPRERLYLLTLGALHDVGMIFIPETVVEKPTALEPAERELVNRHPALGWQLLRESKDADRNLLAHHVCYQHHERQDAGPAIRAGWWATTPWTWTAPAPTNRARCTFSARSARSPIRMRRSRPAAPTATPTHRTRFSRFCMSRGEVAERGDRGPGAANPGDVPARDARGDSGGAVCGLSRDRGPRRRRAPRAADCADHPRR